MTGLLTASAGVQANGDLNDSERALLTYLQTTAQPFAAWGLAIADAGGFTDPSGWDTVRVRAAEWALATASVPIDPCFAHSAMLHYTAAWLSAKGAGLIADGRPDEGARFMEAAAEAGRDGDSGLDLSASECSG